MKLGVVLLNCGLLWMGEREGITGSESENQKAEVENLAKSSFFFEFCTKRSLQWLVEHTVDHFVTYQSSRTEKWLPRPGGAGEGLRTHGCNICRSRVVADLLLRQRPLLLRKNHILKQFKGIFNVTMHNFWILDVLRKFLLPFQKDNCCRDS